MRVGIVLAGGMAKGAYQVGALKAINEYFKPEDITCISCSSIGVLNGYAYTTGKMDAVEKMWRNCCFLDNRLFITTMLKSTYLQESIMNEWSPDDVLPCDMYATLLNVTRRSVEYANLREVPNKKIPRYLRASVAMPVYNRWVTINCDDYYDGAMADNIPVYPLLDKNLDYIICVYFDDVSYIFEKTDFDKKIIKATYKTSSLIMKSLIFNQDSIEDMIELGYTKTKSLLDMVFAKGTEDLDYIYKAIKILNEESGEKKLRITGDFLVTNINKVMQKIVRRTKK